MLHCNTVTLAWTLVVVAVLQTVEQQHHVHSAVLCSNSTVYYYTVCTRRTAVDL
jgi:hypothetical protein